MHLIQKQHISVVIDGKLKVQVGEHSEILEAGDSIYYDSSTPHGMIAVDGKDCTFYAIVLNPTGEPIPELEYAKAKAKAKALDSKKLVEKDTKDRIYHKYIDIYSRKYDKLCFLRIDANLTDPLTYKS